MNVEERLQKAYDQIDRMTEREAVLTAERDAAIARAERAEAEQTSLAIDAARVAVARDEALARAEAAEALAASRPAISPEDAAADIRVQDCSNVDAETWAGARRSHYALRAHAAKVSR